MSKVAGDQTRNWFITGRVEESTADYFALIKRDEEAKEGYEEALAAYDRVLLSDSDFAAAQQHKERVLKKLEELSPAPVPAPVPVDLRRWRQNIIDETWQTLQEVLGAKKAELVLSARSAADPETIIRAEGLTLGIPPTGAQLALVVAVRPKAGAERDIRLQVHPTSSDTLPAGLKIAIFDTSSGTIFRKTQARNASNWIPVPISGKPGEQFSVRIEQGGASATRNFVI